MLQTVAYYAQQYELHRRITADLTDELNGKSPEAGHAISLAAQAHAQLAEASARMAEVARNR